MSRSGDQPGLPVDHGDVSRWCSNTDRAHQPVGGATSSGRRVQLRDSTVCREVSARWHGKATEALPAHPPPGGRNVALRSTTLRRPAPGPAPARPVPAASAPPGRAGTSPRTAGTRSVLSSIALCTWTSWMDLPGCHGGFPVQLSGRGGFVGGSRWAAGDAVSAPGGPELALGGGLPRRWAVTRWQHPHQRARRGEGATGQPASVPAPAPWRVSRNTGSAAARPRRPRPGSPAANRSRSSATSFGQSPAAAPPPRRRRQRRRPPRR